jgi:DNA repair protein RadC
MYTTDKFTPAELKVIRRAGNILASKINNNCIFNSPEILKDYLRMEYAGKDREEFGVIYLDAQHRMIQFKIEFVGTLTQASVYPREIVKAALLTGASSVILVHNHPSGNDTPSRADELLTQTLKSALQLVDVRVLDHFVIGHTVSSFAEKGLI